MVRIASLIAASTVLLGASVSVHAFQPTLSALWNRPVNEWRMLSSSLSLSSSSAAAGIAMDPNWAVQVAQRVQPSVVLVTPTGVRNMTARGSGFVLDITSHLDLPGLAVNATTDLDRPGQFVVTAAHVAAPGYALELADLDGNSHPATVVARNTTLDLALLWMNNDPLGSKDHTIGLRLATNHDDDDDDNANTPPPVGTLAFAHGHPASRLRGPAMTLGIVCGFADGLGVPEALGRTREATTMTTTESTEPNEPGSPPESTIPRDATRFVVTDAAMSGGMSGGPLVDIHGAVLGVNALVRPDLRALGNYAVSALEVRDFLQSIPPHKFNVVKGDDTVEEIDQGQDGTDFSEYKVWLYNDRMNKKERVASVLKAVVNLEETDANKVMMQAHTMGRGEVGAYKDRGEASSVCDALREQDLLVEID